MEFPEEAFLLPSFNRQDPGFLNQLCACNSRREYQTPLVNSDITLVF